jgi:deoxycytidine triphosphate deaminase
MILSQQQIREAVERDEIRFDPPLEERQWHEASVDWRLGFKFTKLIAKPGVKISLAHAENPAQGHSLARYRSATDVDDPANDSEYERWQAHIPRAA